jgi:hypothetical protein
MTVQLKKYFRHDKTSEGSYKQADAIAEQLHAFLKRSETLELISQANSPGRSSSEVQAVFLDQAQTIGFKSEQVGLFKNYTTSGLRPDYYLPLGTTGILLEVERGKTTINNMDILDFWKCHLCEGANFLFLLVPLELRQNSKMSPRREFNTVSNRMSCFFVPRNYTNVWGLWLFGY